MRLEGCAALVTGASRGIGRAIASELAAEGAAVAVNYHANREAAERLVEEIGARGGRAVAVAGDVSRPESASAMVEDARRAMDGLDVLVNNAGIARDGLVYHWEPGAWSEVMQVNFGGVVNCTKAVLDHFLRRGGGCIVNVSSVMAERGWVGGASYAASKAAINAFTRCCALELARFDVRVNAVLPGFCPTDLVAGLTARDGGKGILRQLPTRSFATPDEIAKVVAFLAGPDASYITGSMVPVDGGAASVLGLGHP